MIYSWTLVQVVLPLKVGCEPNVQALPFKVGLSARWNAVPSRILSRGMNALFCWPLDHCATVRWLSNAVVNLCEYDNIERLSGFETMQREIMSVNCYLEVCKVLLIMSLHSCRLHYIIIIRHSWCISYKNWEQLLVTVSVLKVPDGTSMSFKRSKNRQSC